MSSLSESVKRTKMPLPEPSRQNVFSIGYQPQPAGAAGVSAIAPSGVSGVYIVGARLMWLPIIGGVPASSPAIGPVPAAGIAPAPPAPAAGAAPAPPMPDAPPPMPATAPVPAVGLGAS